MKGMILTIGSFLIFTFCQHWINGHGHDTKYTPTLLQSKGPVRVDELESGLHIPILSPDSSLLPSWTNITLYNIGIEFSRKHFFASFLLPIAALPLFVSNPMITPLLIATQKSSTPSTSKRRYVATVLHLKIWYESIMDLKGSRGISDDDSNLDDLMNPHVLQSLYNIRGVHFMLIKKYPWDKIQKNRDNIDENHTFKINSDLWSAFGKDLDGFEVSEEYRQWPEKIRNLDKHFNGTILNQWTLAVTQFMLGGFQVLMPEKGGIFVENEQELKGVMHMWAVLGSAIGIRDDYNVCLQPSLDKARVYFKQMMNRYLIPALFYMKDNDDAKLLYESFVKGFIDANFGQTGESYISVESLMILALEDVLGIPMPNLRASLSMSQKITQNTLLDQVIPMMKRFDSFKDWINGQFISRYFDGGAQSVFGIDGSQDFENIVEKSYA